MLALKIEPVDHQPIKANLMSDNFLRAFVSLFLAAIIFPADTAWGSGDRADGQDSIVRVRIYTDRAEITRRIERTYSDGPGELIVENLPASLIPESVQVSMTQGLPGTLSILNAERNFGTVFSSPAIQRQEEIILELVKNINAESDIQSVLKRQLNVLDDIADGNAYPDKDGNVGASFNAGRADQVIDYIFSKGAEVTKQLRISKTRVEELDKQLSAAEKKLENLKKGAKKQTWRLSGDGHFQGTGKRTFELKYQTRRARWNPAYIARIDTAGKKIRLEYYGEITQSTGEDWQDVPLELSTGNPYYGGAAPKLRPWVVDYYKDHPRIMMDAVESKTLMKSMGAPALMESAPIRKAQAGHALLYALDGKHSISSGSKKMRVGISQNDFDIRLNYLTVPKINDGVYLTGKWVNEGDYEYLPGKAWKYLDGDFVGTGHMKSAVSGQKMKVGLGVDPKIRVKKKLIKKEGGDGGLFNSKNRQRYVFEIKLENFGSIGKQVTVQDQLPLSYQEDILVQVNRLDPKPDKKDKENILNWEIDLQPGEKKLISIDFQVEYPEDKKVSGL